MKLCEKCGACFDDDYDLCGFDGGMLTSMFQGPRVIGGRYLLEQRVAAGAMGVVVRATHLQVGSTVAVKLMRPQQRDTHVALARFQREAQILGQIKHPNAVLVIDFGVERDVPYLVMEYLRGESLSTHLEQKGRLTLDELERIFVPLCEAVEEAHAVGVIHRDIKPGNIVLERLRDGSRIVKVLDFGIAKFVARGRQPPPPPPGAPASAEAATTPAKPAVPPAPPPQPVALAAPAPVSLAPGTRSTTPAPAIVGIEGVDAEELQALLADDDFLDEVTATRAVATLSERRGDGRTPSPEGEPVATGGVKLEATTDANFMIGTIPYMAPEQMTGARVSRRTDVHAVAVLAFQCLAGRLPYDGDDDDIIAAKLSDERPSLSELGIEVPVELDELLTKAFALDPAERPATVKELGDALRAAAAEARDGDAQHAAPARDAREHVDHRDPILDATAQIDAVVRGLTLAAAAVEAWNDVAAVAEGRAVVGEDHYQKARDVLLAVDAPLRRVRAALESLAPPLPSDARAALTGARAALDERSQELRRALARLEARGDGDEFGDYLAALWMRLDVMVQEILDGLRDHLDDETTADGRTPRAPLLPVELFATAPSPRRASLAELADKLLARDPLESVDALDELLADHLDAVVRAFGEPAAATTEESVPTRLARGLWRHADTLLLTELSPARRAFRLLPFLAGIRELPAAAPFALLARLLGAASLDDGAVRAALASCDKSEDRAIVARCLLLHPGESARAIAVSMLELNELWTVIAHPSTPPATLRFLFEHAQVRARPEYLKIFFFCVRDGLRAAASPADVIEVLKLLTSFFTVGCFHEDIVFGPLLDLERAVRHRASALGQLLGGAAGDDAYAEALASFTAAGVSETKPLEHMRDVPLPIQRKLAREGHFLTYFVSHSNDRVARETLPHLLRLEDITPFLRIPTIHRIVLTELAKRKRFFRKEPPKLALLMNPKTPAIVARIYLPLISQDQLRILATNKHINQDVRRLVNIALARPAS